MDLCTATVSNGICLSLGQTFNDYEELKNTVKIYCQETFQRLILRTKSQRQIVYKCCHGIKKNSRPTDLLQYCEAQINFYKGKTSDWKITKLILDHNHPIGQEELVYFGKIRGPNGTSFDSSVSSVDVNFLGKATKRKFGQDEVQNFPHKIFPTNPEADLENIKELLSKIENFDNSYGSSHETISNTVDLVMDKSLLDNNEDLLAILSQREKYNMVFDVAKNIADAVSNYETLSFRQYLEELKIMESNARNGRSLFTKTGNNSSGRFVDETVGIELKKEKLENETELPYGKY